ncbi:MAG: molecular chaperone HtpG, partial [Pseudomonadota bacterium]|nr:molecular chaperone HtpG [Pseudomonadota bacterium]
RMIKEPVSDEEKEKAKQEGPEWETVNKGSALWARPRNEITEEDYNTFYSTLSYDPEPPLAALHNRVEGKLEYISLFFIPGKAPFDLYDREQRHGIKLYVRRIFIADDAKHLMPNYLRFIRGLVDSADLPLNVSREFLQHNREIDKIRAASVKKVLAQLKKMAGKDKEKYAKFWKAFGPALKEGIIEDMNNRDAIAKLLRFATSKSEGEAQTVSLDDYTNRMPVKQKAIYYITADGHAAAASSPLLEIFRKNDTEVLLLSDPVDEWLVNHLHEYEGKPLKSVARGALDLDPEADEKKEKESEKKNFEPLLNKVREILGEQIKEVRLSSRLVDSPSCLIADEHDIGANMERILQAMGQDAPASKPILELNPDHPIIAGIDPESDAASEWAQVLLDQAALAEGVALKDPAGYVKRVNKLLAKAG